MAYDITVKLFSFHLLLMSVVLVAPYASRIADLVFSSTARSRWAEWTQVVFGLYLLGMAGHGASQLFAREGSNAAKPPLYGIWSIEAMTIDGIERAPLVNDYERWRRVIVQDAMTMVFWRMNDTSLVLGAKVNTGAKTISLFRGAKEAGRLTFEQPSPDRLILDGMVDKHTLHMRTQLVDHTNFLLLRRGFHWVQEVNVNQ